MQARTGGSAMPLPDLFRQLVTDRRAGGPDREVSADRRLAQVRRRLDLLILIHLWVLMPLALLWLLAPALRTPGAAFDPRVVGAMIAGAAVYLLIRTVLTLGSSASGFKVVWPYIDVTLITLALGLLRDPTDALLLLYFIPLASAAASLNFTRVSVLAGYTLVGYLLVVAASGTVWTIGLIFRLLSIAVVASLYGRMVRLVTAELLHANRRLGEASSHKSAFLASMSHELRTPLNAILGYVELIQDNIYGEISPGIRDILQRVQRNGSHLLGLINDVLNLSKIEAGQLTLTIEDCSLKDVVQTVTTAMEALASEKRLALTTSVPDDLPAWRGDARRITQVLMNLVGNAVKFTEAGEVRIRVAVADSQFVVSVADTGPGIPGGDRERIFEEFQQAHTPATRAKGGTGLGLAISRRLVELHGGRIGVDSTPGKGSTFWFTLPVRVDEDRISSGQTFTEGARSTHGDPAPSRPE
ncbi:MAG: sensor histidine kinase [bacterium]